MNIFLNDYWKSVYWFFILLTAFCVSISTAFTEFCLPRVDLALGKLSVFITGTNRE